MSVHIYTRYKYLNAPRCLYLKGSPIYQRFNTISKAPTIFLRQCRSLPPTICKKPSPLSFHPEISSKHPSFSIGFASLVNFKATPYYFVSQSLSCVIYRYLVQSVRVHRDIQSVTGFQRSWFKFGRSSRYLFVYSWLVIKTERLEWWRANVKRRLSTDFRVVIKSDLFVSVIKVYIISVFVNSVHKSGMLSVVSDK